MSTSRLVGARIPRREDPRLISGHGRFVDDVTPNRCLHASIVRSPHGHAAVNGVGASVAQARPGVFAVLSRSDFEPLIHESLRVNSSGDLRLSLPQFPIAGSEVVFQGEPVAVVIAGTRYEADDAANAVEVDYEPLPAVTDMLAAMESNSPVVHQRADSNIAWDLTFKDVHGGDIDRALADSDVVVKQRLVQPRVFPLAMEGRGVIASYDAGDDFLTVWLSCQAPYFVRRHLAAGLKMPEARVRVISGDVGGGFGAKIRPYPEEYLIAAASRLLMQPVKWIESRTEGLTATTHGRAEIFDVEAAAKSDGTLMGLRITQYQDLGAYVGFFQTSQTIAVLLAGGCYQWQAVGGRSLGILTNTSTTDPYRGAGRPEAAYISERMVDLLAGELGIDPADLRRKNFIGPEKFPTDNNFGIPYDSGQYRLALDTALNEVGYSEFRQEQLKRRAEGRHIGIGISSYLEICGFAPSAGSAPGIGIGLIESASVRVDPAGGVTVHTGTHAHGQGHETSFTQLVSDALGVDPSVVVVRHGDTGDGPALGLGTYGSRSLAVGGIAILRASARVVDKARKLAADMLEAAPEDVELVESHFAVRGSPERFKTWPEVAAQAYGLGFRDGNDEHGLESTAYFDPPGIVVPFGTHVAIVELDTDTGAVDVLRYVAVDDCGNVINPMIVDGQIQGGITQGLGQALYEEVVYDAESGQLRTGTLLDYKIPTIGEVPKYELHRTVTPTPINELGAKGVGEAGTIGSAAAIINAVCDALAPFGVKHIDMPATPDRVWAELQRVREVVEET